MVWYNAIVVADFVVVATTADCSDVDGIVRMLAELHNRGKHLFSYRPKKLYFLGLGLLSASAFFRSSGVLMLTNVFNCGSSCSITIVET